MSRRAVVAAIGVVAVAVGGGRGGVTPGPLAAPLTTMNPAPVPTGTGPTHF